MIQHEIVIIGGGPAGMAAAISAYDAGCKDVVIIDREKTLGGILMQCIHNGFGLHKLGKELTGPEYADLYAREVMARNIPVYLETTVTSITEQKIVTAQNRNGILKIQATAIILAMGCRERSRGALNIPGSRPAGIYSAGTAQKLVNCMGYQIGKRVVILGSGDIGLIMARRMSLEGAKVEAVCEVMPYSGGLTRNIVQCLEDFSIPLYLSTTVVQIHGEQRLEGVTIAQVDAHRNIVENTMRYIPCDTLLLSVGLIPENELTKMASIPIDPITNGPLVDENCQTMIPGIFSCGNVLQVHDLVDYVSQESERAGRGAWDYVCNKQTPQCHISTKAGSGIRYVNPQIISNTQQDVDLFFRVTDPQGAVTITVSQAENIIFKTKRLKVAPGEMERIRLKAGTIQNQDAIEVKLEVL